MLSCWEWKQREPDADGPTWWTTGDLVNTDHVTGLMVEEVGTFWIARCALVTGFNQNLLIHAPTKGHVLTMLGYVVANAGVPVFPEILTTAEPTRHIGEPPGSN